MKIRDKQLFKCTGYAINIKIFFAEVREHGVGYYSFSTNEKERRRQQGELKKLREHTKSSQLTVQRIKEKRAAQLATRLRAVKRRKKEKLGLSVDTSSGKYIELYKGELTINMPIHVSALVTCNFKLMKQKRSCSKSNDLSLFKRIIIFRHDILPSRYAFLFRRLTSFVTPSST